MKVSVKITTLLLCSNMAEKEDKSNPKKGILKFETEEHETPDPTRKKSTKWDEMNIIATLHPPDKDYGLMKIDEPDTPYNYDTEPIELDPEVLSEKIMQNADKPIKALQPIDETEEDDTLEGETSEERLRRKEFENKRKAHYNEYIIVKQMQEKKDAGPSKDSSSASPKINDKSETTKKYGMKKERKLFLTRDAQGSKEKFEVSVTSSEEMTEENPEESSLISDENEVKEKGESSHTSYKKSVKEKYTGTTSSTSSDKQSIKGKRELPYSKYKQGVQETRRGTLFPKEKIDRKEKRGTSKSVERK